MGCAGSSQAKAEGERGKRGIVKRIKKPRSWKHPQPITISQLIQLREEFWDTAPHYGGRKGNTPCFDTRALVIPIPFLILSDVSFDPPSTVTEIWDALRAAAEADPTLARAIVESAGIILHNPDMTVCFDERGVKYELPTYVLSEPKNLIRHS